jgi:hypothetical protein
MFAILLSSLKTGNPPPDAVADYRISTIRIVKGRRVPREPHLPALVKRNIGHLENAWITKSQPQEIRIMQALASIEGVTSYYVTTIGKPFDRAPLIRSCSPVGPSPQCVSNRVDPD